MRGKDGPNLLQSCAWNVVTSGLTLDGWTHLVRDSGGGMNADKASGILHACLELFDALYAIYRCKQLLRPSLWQFMAVIASVHEHCFVDWACDASPGKMYWLADVRHSG